jgi:MFS family permease
MNDDLKAIERRTVRSFYDDGLTEISLGIIFLVLGGYVYAGIASPVRSFLRALWIVLLIPAFFFAGWLGIRVQRALKHRLTYPRVGYVSFRKERNPRRRLWTGLTGALIGATFPVLMDVIPDFRRALPVFVGVLIAVSFLLMALRSGVTRLQVLAVASIAIGVALTYAGIGGMAGFSLYFVLLGGVMILQGLVALLVFLRRHRRPEEPYNEL